jgi:metal-responsive CopG/Arc/MetJ family transcriptional regulator
VSVVITSYHHNIFDNEQLLTSEEIKQMLQKKIEETEKEARADLFNQGYVEDINTQLQTMQSILADINDEETRRIIIDGSAYKWL